MKESFYFFSCCTWNLLTSTAEANTTDQYCHPYEWSDDCTNYGSEEKKHSEWIHCIWKKL